MGVKTKVIPLKSVALYDPERDGVSHSLLAKFKSCRQAARDALEGWTTRRPSFHLTFGSLTHYVLNQAYDNVLIHQDRTVPKERQVIRWLEDARRIWMHEHPVHDSRIDQIFEEAILKASATLPMYFRYWKTDFTKRNWLEIENEFKIPMATVLPTGRTVNTFLRGKIDGAFVLPKSKNAPKPGLPAPRLMETKTRTQVNEEMIVDTLALNQQTGIYCIALEEKTGRHPVEVELNIIRKTALRQGKNESLVQYESRVRTDVQSRPDWYFIRMKMDVTLADMVRMRTDVTNLVTDFLLWWYGESPHYRNDQSCSLYNRPCDMLQKCTYNDTADLFKRKTIFSELEDE